MHQGLFINYLRLFSSVAYHECDFIQRVLTDLVIRDGRKINKLSCPPILGEHNSYTPKGENNRIPCCIYTFAMVK